MREEQLYCGWAEKVPGSNKKGVMNMLMVPSAETVRKNPQTAWKYYPKSWCPLKKTAEWNDWAGVPGFCGKWATQDTELKTAGPRLPILQRTQQMCPALTCGAALKLRIEYEWVIPDENIPVFTLFTEGATYHSVSLNSSFQWPRLQSFNLLHEPGPQLVVSIQNCWSLLSCITGLASELKSAP